jgi:hypothetical protein
MRVEAGIGADAPPLPPQFALYGLHPVARWRLRHIPGPAFHWLKGNVDEIMALGGLHAAYDAWSHAYGPLFRVFLGGQPVVVVADGSIARSVSVKHGSRPPFRGPAELVFDNPFARAASRLNAMRDHDMLQTQDAAYHRGERGVGVVGWGSSGGAADAAPADLPSLSSSI